MCVCVYHRLNLTHLGLFVRHLHLMAQFYNDGALGLTKYDHRSIHLALGLICFVSSVLHKESKLEYLQNQPHNITKRKPS